MQKKYKIGLIIVAVLIIITICLGIMSIFHEKKENTEENETKIISNIKNYGYTLEDRDTKYMKEVFKELESVLDNDEADYESYAKCISKLFIIDFYTLNNKINMYDVGGLEYILSSKADMFKIKAIDTIYNTIEDNTYKNRLQDLPEIVEVNIDDFTTDEYTLDEKKVDAYKVDLSYKYKEDFGYDKKGTLYIIKNDKKLEIVKYDPLK